MEIQRFMLTLLTFQEYNFASKKLKTNVRQAQLPTPFDMD